MTVKELEILGKMTIKLLKIGEVETVIKIWEEAIGEKQATESEKSEKE